MSLAHQAWKEEQGRCFRIAPCLTKFQKISIRIPNYSKTMTLKRISKPVLNLIKKYGYSETSDDLPLCIDVEIWLRRTYGWSFEVGESWGGTYSYAAYLPDFGIQLFNDSFPTYEEAFDDMVIEVLGELSRR